MVYVPQWMFFLAIWILFLNGVLPMFVAAST